MTHITLKQLTAAIAVADAGRFKTAADNLNLSQPALSEQIARLEEVLGAKLFERGPRGATLTPIGEEVVKRARKLMADVAELEQLANRDADALGGSVRLGALPTVGPYLLPHAIPGLHTDYPGLRLHVREARTTELEARLRGGEFDVILCTPPKDGDGLIVELLVQEPLRLGVAHDHHLADQPVIAAEDLCGLDLLTLEAGHHLAERTRELAAETGARVQIDYAGTSLDGVRQMVGLGMGAAIVPGLYQRSEMDADASVVVRDLGIVDPWRWIALVWRKSSPRTEAFRTLAARLAACARERLGIIEDSAVETAAP